MLLIEILLSRSYRRKLIPYERAHRLALAIDSFSLLYYSLHSTIQLQATTQCKKAMLQALTHSIPFFHINLINKGIRPIFHTQSSQMLHLQLIHSLRKQCSNFHAHTYFNVMAKETLSIPFQTYKKNKT